MHVGIVFLNRVDLVIEDRCCKSQADNIPIERSGFAGIFASIGDMMELLEHGVSPN
jgi:hypothetical protein